MSAYRLKLGWPGIWSLGAELLPGAAFGFALACGLLGGVCFGSMLLAAMSGRGSMVRDAVFASVFVLEAQSTHRSGTFDQRRDGGGVRGSAKQSKLDHRLAGIQTLVQAEESKSKQASQNRCGEVHPSSLEPVGHARHYPYLHTPTYYSNIANDYIGT